ncbi:NMT1/THI5 like domain protein [Bacillus methanolicus PB1]|uniref:NMT1/THI5 like domain protein n=1 Tax=Bacillus methanolicus PB1 TaxID=997296 RepID=I3E1Q3_BACMT|nr:ABC transporter substrate-binding protein [Bacillus methanolicus]EIJ80424.1 NMT1/THI5 like domain protein [Bacillus methanolicus PB1]
MRRQRNSFKTLLILLIFPLLLLAGCGNRSASTESTNTSEKTNDDSKDLVKVKQVTNWFAEPEHGGNYAALMKNFYKDAGIDMTIEPGGPQISSTQMVASGEADFGIVQADDILLARDQGIPVVAIGAIFQVNPQAILYHADQNIKDFSDLNGRTVYTAPGVGYWEYIKKAYKLDKVKEMTYNGQLTQFIRDKKAATQCYITAEPFSLKQQGVETKYLLIHDSGYQPYANVIFTTEKMIKENPDLVKRFMEATIRGWEYYKDYSDEINPFLQKYNPDLTIEAMKFGAEQQKDFIYGHDAAEKGIGYMSKERWLTLQKQLIDLGLIKKKEDINKAYTIEFLPNK